MFNSVITTECWIWKFSRSFAPRVRGDSAIQWTLIRFTSHAQFHSEWWRVALLILFLQLFQERTSENNNCSRLIFLQFAPPFCCTVTAMKGTPVQLVAPDNSFNCTHDNDWRRDSFFINIAVYSPSWFVESVIQSLNMLLARCCCTAWILNLTVGFHIISQITMYHWQCIWLYSLDALHRYSCKFCVTYSWNLRIGC